MKGIRDTFRQDSRYQVFFLAIFLTGLGYGIHKGMIDNYLAEIVVMGEMDRGILEFFRELPGFLMVFILAVFYQFTAEKLYKIGAVILVIGMGMLSVISPGKVLVTVAICIYSLGEHIQLGMKSTISLVYSKPGKGGRALGYQSSVTQIGTLLGFLVIIAAFGLIKGEQPFRLFFVIAAAITAAGAAFAFGLNSKSETDKSKRRFYFAKKYKKYYMLEVFYGARKQVFMTFGPYVLILFYKAETMTISLLFAISAVASFLMAPVVGRIIDRLGYKVVMISDTLILVVVCFFYGFAHHLFPMDTAFIICCVNYVLDAVISLASMAASVYVQDISDDPEEVKATLSTGISVNHLITLFIALFGGWVWQTVGIETLFMISAALGLMNSAYAATVKPPKRLADKGGQNGGA
ncbi:MAG: MFS transporter [Lachnospiraceae bacterium]|nr:MFS transporter [Lachnospiraceae bacterium]